MFQAINLIVCAVMSRDKGKRMRAYSWIQDKGEDLYGRVRIIDTCGFARSFRLVVALAQDINITLIGANSHFFPAKL